MSRLGTGIVILGLLLAGCKSVSGRPPGQIPGTAPLPEGTQSPLARAARTSLPTATPSNTRPAATVTSTPTLETQTPEPAKPKVPDELARISVGNAERLAEFGALQFDPWELVTALDWAPNGSLLAISSGNTVRLVDPWNQAQLAALDIGAFSYSIKFDPQGSWLAVGSRDGMLRIWSLPALLGSAGTNVAPHLSLQAHKKGVNSIAFSPDGLILASGGSDAVARFWDPASGAMLGSVIGGTFVVPGIAFLPQGDTLAVINGDVVRLRSTTSESILGTFLSETSLYCLSFNPDGTWMAAGGVDNRIRLWDPSTAFRSGQETYPDPIYLTAHNGDPGSYKALIWQVLFSPDGQVLATAGGDATIRIWGVENASLLTTLKAHPLGVASIAFHPDGLALASGGLDGSIRLWGISE